MKIEWNEENIEILKQYYPTESWDIVLEKLNTKSKTAIMSKASKLGIKRHH